MRLSLLIVLVSLTAVAAAGPARDVPLSATYRDATGDGVRSDGLTSFTGSAAHYVHGVDDNALVILQEGGQYRFSTRLDAKKPLRRRLCLNFGEQPAPSFGAQHCADILIGMHGDGRIQDMQLGEVLDKRVKHSWLFDGYEYRLGFGVDWNGDNAFDGVPVGVTCIGASADGACTTWSMVPGGPASLARVKRLSGNRLGDPELVGYFDMPFEVQFRR